MMENNDYLLIRKEQLILLNLADNIGFNEWFDEYSEKHHYLNGWLDKDTYLDEVELPLDLYMGLVQKFLREKHNVIVENCFNGDEKFYWLVREFKPFGYEFDSINEDICLWDNTEDALLDGLINSCKYIINNKKDE